MAERKVVTDFGLWGALTGPSLPHIEGQHAEGALGFKAFMARLRPLVPARRRRGVPGGHADRRRVRRAGAGARGERQRCCRPTAPGCGRRGAPTRWPTTSRGRPSSRRRRCNRALFLAAHAGVRLQVVHVSSPVSGRPRQGGAGTGAAGDVRDLPASPAARPRRPRAARALRRAARPALRPRGLVERLWEPRAETAAPTAWSPTTRRTCARRRRSRAGRTSSRRCWAAQVIQETVPLVLDEAVHRRGMAARRLRALLVHQRRPHRRPVPAQGHDPAGRRRRPRALRPRRAVDGRRREPAALEEPVVAVRRPPRAGPLRADARARRDRAPRRRDPRGAGPRPVPVQPGATTRRARRGRHGELPARPAQPEHRRRHTRRWRRRARRAARRRDRAAAARARPLVDRELRRRGGRGRAGGGGRARARPDLDAYVIGVLRRSRASTPRASSSRRRSSASARRRTAR